MYKIEKKWNESSLYIKIGELTIKYFLCLDSYKTRMCGKNIYWLYKTCSMFCGSDSAMNSIEECLYSGSSIKNIKMILSNELRKKFYVEKYIYEI